MDPVYTPYDRAVLTPSILSLPIKHVRKTTTCLSDTSEYHSPSLSSYPPFHIIPLLLPLLNFGSLPTAPACGRGM